MHGLLLVDTPADPNSTSSWFAVVVALLTIIYIVAVRPMKKKRNRDPLARQPSSTLLSQQRSIERDMTALLVDYEQMMRTMTAQIDMRTTKLEVLMHEADEKLAALKAASAAPAQVPASAPAAVAPPKSPEPAVAAATVVSSPVPVSPTINLEIVEAVPATAMTSAMRAERLSRQARELQGTAEDFIATPADHADGAAAEPHAEIYALADRGLSYRQIAHQLSRAYGEIELILALRPRVSDLGPADHQSALPDAVDTTEEVSTSTPHPNRIHARGNQRSKHRRKQPI